MANEEWRPIPGFEGLYSVSSLGRVRRDAQMVTLHPKRFRYLGYTISKPGRRSSHWVHTLVAAVFLGDRPTGHHIHHKDGNHLNNALDNLEYLSPQVHATKRRSYRGAENPKAKLSDEDVRAIRAADCRKGRKITQAALAAQYGVSIHTIRALRNRWRRRELWIHAQ